MDWAALARRINYAFGLISIGTTLSFRLPRRQFCGLKWLLCTVLLFLCSAFANSNWQFKDQMLQSTIIFANLPGRILIIALAALQMWLCWEMEIWDALGLLAICISCEKMQFALYQIIETGINDLLPGELSEVGTTLLNVALMALVCVAVGIIFQKNRWHLHIPPYSRVVIVLTLGLLFMAEAINLYLFANDPYITSGKVMAAQRLDAILINFVTLYMMYNLIGRRTLLMEQEAMEAITQQRSNQYAFSQDLIDTINIKSHDLKKQIRYLKDNQMASEELIAELEESVAGYDSLIQTQNETLSTVLTEKSMVCHRHGIPFSCVADGSGIDFMKPLDIYTLFANLMDNAIEASLAPGLERRCIILVVKRQAGFLSVHEENYCLGQVKLLDGLPVTSKADTRYHGFGTRSIRQIAERYDGTMQVKVEDGLFSVNLLIPIP